MTFLVTANAVGIFFKPLLDEFHWDRATLSLVVSISMLVFAVVSPFLGRLIDHFGPRIILLGSVASQILSSVVSGLANGIVCIYIGRLLYELKPIHSTQVLINRWFVRKRGRALGILSTGIPLGTLVLSPISQYLILKWSWRTTYFFWAGVTALVGLPLILWIRNKPEDKGLLTDGELPAGELATIAVSRPMFDAVKLKAQPDTGNTLVEAAKSGSFWLLSATQLICGISCGLLMTHTVIFTTDLGYSPIIGASFLSVHGGVSLLGVLVTGLMSDRFSRNKVLSLTHFIRSLSFLILVITILTVGDFLPLLYLAMVFFGFGWFTTAPLAAGLVADLFGNLRMGTILGIILASHMVGMAIGTYAGGITYQLTGSYLNIFIITGALELLACFFALIIKSKAGVVKAPKLETGLDFH